ncbi:putative signal peptide protein [Roseibium sp. TrichSKD4]|uniref:quinoprotein dehydrogenase-associated SoxYZ-like carrier n=1 Tax=Roseibium sp. TrichSKD4 TaxID=744980 RepID=UPI0001E56DB4|nr:quinoprotein dehydrogenase-associated SoxYZ-like carrier [Roseibium sp. TrichSKD4]EFO30274.1 putative signal peptide protein [Roseibium sp. TrichSKD4]
MPGQITPSLSAMTAALVFAGFLSQVDPAQALEPSWPDLKASLYDNRFVALSDDVVKLEFPYRSSNDARTDINVRLDAPDSSLISRFSLILDENPMPVSAVIDFAEPIDQFNFTATMRINGQTPIHAVAELDNGQLFMAEGYIKTSGLGACSAPPGTDPVEALKTLGQMALHIGRVKDSSSLMSTARGETQSDLELDVDIKHPSHSGMQMDQISLLYIPARYVETLEINLNGAPFATMTGSISLSENPSVSMSVPSSTRRIKARLTDTDGTVTEAEQSLADY